MKQFLSTIILLFIAEILFAQVPTITSFTPKKGNPGTVVTITGTNFGSTPSQNIVYFGAAPGVILSANSTTIVVLSPVGATYGPINITTVAGSPTPSRCVFSKTFFTPTFSPKKGSLASADFLAKVDYTGTYSLNGQKISKLNAISLYNSPSDGKNNLITSSDVLVNNPINLIQFINNSVPGSVDSTSFSAYTSLPNGSALYNAGNRTLRMEI